MLLVLGGRWPEPDPRCAAVRDAAYGPAMVPCGELWLEGDRAVLDADYDAKLVELIRAIPGRRWDPYEREWSVELTPDRAQALAGLITWADGLLEVEPELEEELAELVAQRDPGRLLLELTPVERQPHVTLCLDGPAETIDAVCGSDPVRDLPEVGRRVVALTPALGQRALALAAERDDVELAPALRERISAAARREGAATARLERAAGGGSSATSPPSARGSVRWRTGGWPSPALVITLPARPAGLAARARALLGARRERGAWVVPAWDPAAESVAELLEAVPGLEVEPRVHAWLEQALAWHGTVTVLDDGERRWLAAVTEHGRVPDGLRSAAEPRGSWLLLPADADGAAVLAELEGAELDPLAAHVLEHGEPGPGARLALRRDALAVEPRWDRAIAAELLDGVEDARAEPREGAWRFAQDAVRVLCPLDLWSLPELEEVLRDRDVFLEPGAEARLGELRAARTRAREVAAASRAREAELALPELGGELRPFQRAGVAYALAQRRTFLADEQGLGKTIEALAALEADGAFPAVVVCPASLKLNWRREAARWLPHRSVQLLAGTRPAPVGADIAVVNYDVLPAHGPSLAAARPRALVLDEAHYVKNPKAHRTRAAQELADAVAPDGLKLALTGTPVLNRPGELVAPLRILDRLRDVGGSGEGFRRRFARPHQRERLHAALRSTGFLRRLKAEVLPQLPAKRQSVVPVALGNEREYRLAEEDLIAWLRTQPGDLRELDARVARALRAEQLARLNALRVLAARGKLGAALAWIEDFLASGEPLVVFARLREVQRALVARFPAAAHVLGADTQAARHDAVRAFQQTEAHPLIVCSLEVGGQGITLTRASNVCFLELDWTPARHDQAEDRCHRIGQDDAVTAWYLLAADTIDEAMAEVLERKRATIGAVTDGRVADEESMVEAVVRALRAKPQRHLRAVA